MVIWIWDGCGVVYGGGNFTSLNLVNFIFWLDIL